MWSLQCFRSARDASGGEAADQVNGALRALRVLSEQTHLLDCTSESVTEGVHVEITSTFLGVSDLGRKVG